LTHDDNFTPSLTFWLTSAAKDLEKFILTQGGFIKQLSVTYNAQNLVDVCEHRVDFINNQRIAQSAIVAEFKSRFSWGSTLLMSPSRCFLSPL